MPDGDSLHRVASALRTSLVGHRVLRFEASELLGPVPRAGRVVERVEHRGRRLEIEFDDGLVLDTQVRRSGAWHLYHAGDRWRRPHHTKCALVEVPGWQAVCFNASSVETYRASGRHRHPAMGRIGPDLTRHDADLRQVVDLLLSTPNRDVPLADVLLDQRIMRGVGNVFRCEVLWANELSPFAPVSNMSQHDAIRLVNAAAHIVRSHLGAESGAEAGLAVYGRNGQRCERCGETIEMRPLGVRRHRLFWCPGCQTHLDPRADPDQGGGRVMDPHPAARRFIADLPWNRDAG